jgi:hypothetical protein
MSLGLIQLDGGWLEGRRRFWYLTPAQIVTALTEWAGTDAERAVADEDIRAWARRQPPDHYGREVVKIAAQMLRKQ